MANAAPKDAAARLLHLRHLCTLTKSPWDPAWDKPPPSTFHKYKLKRARDAKCQIQRRGIVDLSGQYCEILLAAQNATGALAAYAVVVAIYDYYASTGHVVGEPWYAGGLPSRTKSAMQTALVSCAEVRAVACVSKHLRDAWRCNGGRKRPPCCFVRCAVASIIGTELDSEASRRRLWERLTMPKIGPVKPSSSGVAIQHGPLRSAVDMMPDVPRLARLLAPPLPFPEPAFEPPVPITPEGMWVGAQVSVRWVWLARWKDGRRQASPAWVVDDDELDAESSDGWMRATVADGDAEDEEVGGDDVVLVKYERDPALGVMSGKTDVVPIGHVGVGWPTVLLGWPGLCEGMCARYATPPCLPYLVRCTPTSLLSHPLFTSNL